MPKTPPPSNAQLADDASAKGSYWLYLGNKASERGDLALAERHYAKSQKWHDLMNHYLGNIDPDAPADLKRK